MLEALRQTLAREPASAFERELRGRLGQLGLNMVDGRVLPAHEVAALRRALVELGASALPQLTRRSPSVARALLSVLEREGADLSGNRTEIDAALVDRAPHLRTLLPIFDAPRAEVPRTLTQWFSGFIERSGLLRGHSTEELVELCTEDPGPWAGGGRGTAHDACRLITAIADQAGREDWHDDRWAVTFDFKDRSSWTDLAGLIDVPDDEALRALFRQRVHEGHGRDVDFPDFLDLCNARAHVLGRERRLFQVPTGGDNVLVIALPPAVCAQLVTGGFLYVDTFIPDLSDLSQPVIPDLSDLSDPVLPARSRAGAVPAFLARLPTGSLGPVAIFVALLVTAVLIAVLVHRAAGIVLAIVVVISGARRLLRGLVRRLARWSPQLSSALERLIG